MSEHVTYAFLPWLRRGVARICAAFHPRPVLVRLSDLKSNEYRELLGGRGEHQSQPSQKILRGQRGHIFRRF